MKLSNLPRPAIALISASLGATLGAVGVLELKKPTGKIHTDFSNAVADAYVASPERDSMLVVNGVGSVNADGTRETVSYGLIGPKGALKTATLTLTDASGETTTIPLAGGTPAAEAAPGQP